MTATVAALAVPRALTPPERAKLRAQLKAQLKIVTDDDATDAEDLLDYVLETVEGGKAAGHVAKELSQPPLLPVCGEAEAAKVGETLAAFFASLETGGQDDEDDAAAALQERLASLKKKKSERLASVQSQRAAFVGDLVASLEKGKAVVAVEKKKRGAPSPPSLSSMTVAELKEELHVRNNSGYIPNSRIALEAALAAARKKDGTDEAPQAAVKESGGGQEEEKAKEEGDIEEAMPTAVGGIQQPSIAIKQGNGKAGAKEARLYTGRQVKVFVTKPSQDCRLGIGLTGNDGTIRITSIAQDGLFARTNLKVGQVLGTINGAPCKTATEAVARMREAKGVVIVAYEGVGDIEQGAATASAGRSIFDGGSWQPTNASAGRSIFDGGSAQVRPNSRPATRSSGAHDDDGKQMGSTIFSLLLMSFILTFIPLAAMPYIAGACNILALILTSAINCKCCCAVGYELKPNAQRFISAALLSLTIMFILNVIGGYMLFLNNMEVTSGIMTLSAIVLTLQVIGMIFVGLFTWGRHCCSN
ncbi:hypothetical protein ACHAXT_001694 [Thalassiosira profunda]